MPTPADRIRRVLSDGAHPRPQRARAVLRQVTDADAQATAEDAAPPSLAERLAVIDRLSGRAGPLRRASDTTEAHPPPAGLAPPAPRRMRHAQVGDVAPDATLEACVGGVPRETPSGTCLQVDHAYDLHEPHGRVVLASALDHPVPLRRHERAPQGAARLDLRQAVFLDTETTGLAGGTGTVAFLVGIGWIDGDVFRVRQYCMRDYPEEAALLEAVKEDLGDRPLVTFNGRSYDWPLLVTRWKLNRTRWRERGAASAGTSPYVPTPRAHLDLLPPARRLWARTLPSRSLGTLERHVIGLARGDDLPGAQIPAAYFHYLRTGYAHTIARAFRHNEIDVISMLALVGRVGGILAEPERRDGHPEDHVGTARLLLDLEQPVKARRCLEAGLAQAASSEESLSLRRLLGWLCRRHGEDETALTHWRAVAEGASTFDLEAYEQVAKIYEHRLGDFEAALRWTRAALERCASGSRAQADLEHRATRLERRRG